MGSGAEHQGSLVKKEQKREAQHEPTTMGREQDCRQQRYIEILREHDDLVLLGKLKYLNFFLIILKPHFGPDQALSS